MTTNDLKKYALAACGTVAVLLGLFGMILPVLPTTPFLLLAAFCFMRSSHRLYAWLISHRLFGPTIRNYLQHRAVRKRTRLMAMAVLWSSLLLSILIIDRTPVRLLLLVIGLGVSWHLAALKTLPQARQQAPEDVRDASSEPVPGNRPHNPSQEDS